MLTWTANQCNEALLPCKGPGISTRDTLMAQPIASLWSPVYSLQGGAAATSNYPNQWRRGKEERPFRYLMINQHTCTTIGTHWCFSHLTHVYLKRVYTHIMHSLCTHHCTSASNFRRAEELSSCHVLPAGAFRKGGNAVANYTFYAAFSEILIGAGGGMTSRKLHPAFA